MLVAILDNLRSVHNVGSIFRTADGLGIERLYLCGTTPHPHPDQPWRKDHLALAKTALGAEQTVDWEYAPDTLAVVTQLAADGWTIVALEITPESQPLIGYQPTADKLALVVGPERTGLAPELLAQAAATVAIPMYGAKESLNVSVAFGIAAFWLGNQKTACKQAVRDREKN